MSNTNDQVNEKAVVIIIKAAKLDAKILAKAFQAIMKNGAKFVKKITTPKNMSGKGKQTVKQLVGQGQGVSNIEINDKNIKSFETTARKYGVDFAVKKDTSESPPKWLVFFKARDADALTSAFKEFSTKIANRSKQKPSVLAALSKYAELVKNQVVDKEKSKSRGGHEL
jgi:hypothetical protein